MAMGIAILTGVWRGAEIERFVQSYTTRAYSELMEDQWVEALVLDRQGRVIATIALQKHGATEVVFAIPEALYGPLEAHLQIYCKMMRVEIKLQIIEGVTYTPKSFYPWLTQAQSSGIFTAHDLSADVLGLINFHKGCYLGQEIVARVQSRVTEHRKRLAMSCATHSCVDYTILYSQSELTIGVLSRSQWKAPGVVYVWDSAN